MIWVERWLEIWAAKEPPHRALVSTPVFPQHLPLVHSCRPRDKSCWTAQSHPFISPLFFLSKGACWIGEEARPPKEIATFLAPSFNPIIPPALPAFHFIFPPSILRYSVDSYTFCLYYPCRREQHKTQSAKTTLGVEPSERRTGCASRRETQCAQPSAAQKHHHRSGPKKRNGN